MTHLRKVQNNGHKDDHSQITRLRRQVDKHSKDTNKEIENIKYQIEVTKLKNK